MRPPARAVFNAVGQMERAALDGIGIASLPEDIAASSISEGKLVRVLADWSPVRSGYHLYYPSRRQQSPAFAIVLEALRRHLAKVD